MELVVCLVQLCNHTDEGFVLHTHKERHAYTSDTQTYMNKCTHTHTHCQTHENKYSIYGQICGMLAHINRYCFTRTCTNLRIHTYVDLTDCDVVLGGLQAHGGLYMSVSEAEPALPIHIQNITFRHIIITHSIHLT